MLRTTSDVMFSSNCPAGYFSDFRSSGLEDFYLCEPGYYCPLGTSKTKYKQNTCLQDYYCPRGTAAEINMYTGKFRPETVVQILDGDIKTAIYTMLRSTLPVFNNFNQDNINQ